MKIFLKKCLTNSQNRGIIISESEGTVMKRVYAEENLVRVRPMVKHPITNSNVFRKMHDRTVSTKRIKEFVKSSWQTIKSMV